MVEVGAYTPKTRATCLKEMNMKIGVITGDVPDDFEAISCHALDDFLVLQGKNMWRRRGNGKGFDHATGNSHGRGRGNGALGYLGNRHGNGFGWPILKDEDFHRGSIFKLEFYE
jgi:hypothetical protein